MISHGNYRAMLDMVVEKNVLGGDDELTYLFLPLAHSFALLIQFGNFELGASLAYWERDPLRIMANLAEVKPTYFPSVPRIFEKIYTAATVRGREGGRPQEADLRLVDRRSASATARPSARAAPGRCCGSSTGSPTASCSRRSGTCSAATCASRSPAPRRSTRTSCASSTPPASWSSRAGA